MSIFPATDIVSDAARAADPRKAQMAMRRLESAGGPSAFAPAAPASMQRPGGSSAPLQAATARTEQAGMQSSGPAAAAARKFEAFVLQSWLETLLPKEDTGLFGSDGAGGVWRSMLAEQLAEQIAAAGGVGLQKLLNVRTAAEGGPRAGG